MKQFDSTVVKKAAGVFRAVQHPLRRQMLELIDSKPELTVGELCAELDISPSTASQQLFILREARLVQARRNGKARLYSIHEDHVAALQRLAEEIVNMLKQY